MAYTNNVPQGNQQIATTQPLIQANFGFIQTDAQVEHIFNGNAPFGVQAEGTHVQASMPNQPLMGGALPAGTNGVYYINNGIPTFYTGTLNYQLNPFQSTLSNAAFTFGATHTYQNIIAVPANTMGLIIMLGPTMAKKGAQIGTWISDAANCYAFSSIMDNNANPSDELPVQFNNNNNALFINGRSISGSYNGPYNIKVFVRPI